MKPALLVFFSADDHRAAALRTLEAGYRRGGAAPKPMRGGSVSLSF